MAEAAAAYYTLDINSSAKPLHSCFIKADKYSLAVGYLLSEEIPEGYLMRFSYQKVKEK